MIDQVTGQTLRTRKGKGEPIAGLTAYDYPTAVLIDRAGLDLVLVGDTLGRLILGKPRAEETTMEDMIHHCRAVSRGVRRAMVIGDMPFGSYEVSPTAAVENAIRLVKEGGVGAVKVEGGLDVVPAVRAIADAHVPVVGHLTPAHAGSGGSGGEAGDSLVHAARVLEGAGVAAIVLVGIAPEVARAITESLQTIPSIGYRSGPFCDGHLLVTPFMLGLLPVEAPQPGPYGALGQQLAETFSRFREDVFNRSFDGA
jgi:3-methyl-2-oxobutanoate hydroxymethyltransferase